LACLSLHLTVADVNRSNFSLPRGSHAESVV
jgi:hypothetical protein